MASTLEVGAERGVGKWKEEVGTDGKFTDFRV